MTKLILVRHGQSEANVLQCFAGNYNCNLTEYGLSQAERLSEFLYENFSIDKIYSSDLNRAYSTALPTAKKLSLDIEKNSNMREISAGLWEGMSFSDILEKYRANYEVWLTDIGNAQCNEGESVKDLYERVCREITKIAKENDGKTVLIATHATPIRVFQTYVEKGDVSFARDYQWVPNCSVTVCNYKNGKFELEQIGYNDYLKELKTKLPIGIV